MCIYVYYMYTYTYIQVQEMEANPVATAADRLARLKAQVEEGTKAMGESREELMRLFMAAEQQKPALQSSVYTWLYMYVYMCA